MTERKFTDEEVIRALECLAGAEESCVGCIYQSTPFPTCRELVARQALDLINRQRAEIQQLTNVIKQYEQAYEESRKEHAHQMELLRQLEAMLTGGQK